MKARQKSLAVLVLSCLVTGSVASEVLPSVQEEIEQEIYQAEVEEERVDLDGDNLPELIRVTWQAGGSDKPIRVDVFDDSKIIQTLGPVMGGIQSNYALRDSDGDERPELIIWSGLWDPRLPGEDGLQDQEYEGHSGPHRYMVATYKWIRGSFQIWDLYTTKKTYDPYPDDVPEQ